MGKTIKIPVIPFDEQNTEDAAGKSTKGKLVPGAPGNKPEKGKTYGTGP